IILFQTGGKTSRPSNKPLKMSYLHHMTKFPVLLVFKSMKTAKIDVFLCGDTVEKAVETNGGGWFVGPSPGGHSHNEMESIKRDWAGKCVMHLLPGQWDAHCPQGSGSALQLCVPGCFPGL